MDCHVFSAAHSVCPFRLRALTLALLSGAALAQPDEPATLSEITTRTSRRVDDVPSTVTVTPAERIERGAPRDVKDLFRHELDITVRAAPARFTAAGSSTGRAGNEGINIRGLEGNQVLLLVDGIRVPNSFAFGPFATGRGDFLPLDFARSVEVLRGPASAAYGSDGLAGAVLLRTLEPDDLLRGRRDAAARVRLSAAQVDRSIGLDVAGAGRSGAWDGLLMLSTRRGHETSNQGTNDAPDSTRTKPNPQDSAQTGLVGKVGYRLDAAHRFGLTLEAQRRRSETEVLSGRAPASATPAATAVIDLDARDRLSRERVSVEHRYADADAALVQRATTQLYAQRAEVHQFSAEDRFSATDRTRDNTYEQRVIGLSTQFESRVDAEGSQRLSYGLDASRSEFTGLRSGTVPPPGESFPSKPFPDTAYTLAGAFVQGEIELGSLSLMPALRLDAYRLNPSADGYGGSASGLSDRAVTPRLGGVWRIDPAFAPYGQWARGFRAPTPDQVNNGFTNAAAGYQSIGNPALRAERANGLEAGFRGRLGDLRYSVAGYDNRYRDFISQQIVSGSGLPGVDPFIFQYVNLASARIRGIEIRTEWTPSPAWTIAAGSALSRGSTETAGNRVALDTIEPLRNVLDLKFRDGAWEWRATVLHGQGKAADRVAPSTNAPYLPPSYTTLDLGTTWTPRAGTVLSLNVFNVGDKRYWRWSDVRGVAVSSTVKDAFTAPGRSVQVALRQDF
jgi:hemoglobin/transferrin/lactoferrin receptor protein